MSTLKKYQKNPRHLLNTALSIYRSKMIKTVIVEGVCDKRFLSQWSNDLSKVRFEGLEGKQLVEDVYVESRVGTYAKYDFSYLFADVDYDSISGKALRSDPCFIYNTYCNIEDKVHYNDLETFLINSSALGKFLANMDIDTSEVDQIRSKLEKSSRIIGRLRAADFVLKRKKNLRKSILNGLEVRGFLSPADLTFDERVLHSAIPRWSNYPEYVDDLIDEAKKIDRETPLPWSLSRGHDLTEMLAMHLESRGKRGITSDKIELMLRLACEYGDFKSSPMGKQFFKSGGLALMSYVDA